jgi:hypothetical protein
LQHLTRICVDYPRTTLALLILITAAFAAGLPRVRPEFGYRVLVGDQHPAVETLDRFIERFGGGLPIQIGWECGPDLPCSSVFDATSMAMAAEVTSDLLAVEGVSSVLGPSNAPLLVPAPGGFSVRRLVEHGRLASDASQLADLARSDALWRGVLVSPDGSAAVIVVQPIDSTQATSVSVSESVERVLERHERAGYRFHLTGDPIQNLIVGRDLAESTSRLIPFTIIVIGLILYLSSRSLRSTLISLITMCVALAWTFGLLGWLGWPQDGILEVLAPLILVVGVCDAVHLLSRYEQMTALLPRAAGARPGRDELLAVATRLSGPCLITTLTTAAAFLSFVTSDLATFVRFGTIAAFGCVACLILTFSLLPLLVIAFPTRGAQARRVSQSWDIALNAILRSSEKRAIPVLAACVFVLGICAVGWWAHLRVDHEWTESLGDQSRVVQSWRFMEDRLGFSDTLEVEVVLPDGTQLENPDTLRRLSSFSEFLGGLENLRDPRSIVDIIRKVNRLLHQDDAAYERIGDTTIANAEIIELVSFDDPGLLASWISFDRARMRISVGAPEQAFSTRGRVIESIEEYSRQFFPASWEAIPTGRVAMQFAWIKDVQTTQLRSFPTALVLVFAMVAVFLRSMRLAVVAMVPTILPVVVTLGIMGWTGMTLDVGRAMIAAILLGIAVDDSIHILDRYRERRALGECPRRAISEAILHTGRAVVTTSLALALGFLTLMASAWQSIASFGFFVSLAILGALAASLFVLPALIFALARGHGESGLQQNETRAHRGQLTSLLVALPVLIAIIAAITAAAADSRNWHLSCWVLPRGHVLTLPGTTGCPLQLLDQIRWVENESGVHVAVGSTSEIRDLIDDSGPVARFGVVRRGIEHVAEIALEETTATSAVGAIITSAAIAASLLVLPILLLLHSSSRVALPLGVFYSATGVVLVTGLAGHRSELLSVGAIVALVVAPAALAQLTMVFPTRSTIVRLAPNLYLSPYVLSVVLLVLACLVLDQAPVLWPTFTYLIIALLGTIWLILMTLCAFAIRESPSASGRARAGFVLVASLALPAILVVPFAWENDVSEIATAYLFASALVIPLPIGFAISRYNLFDVGFRTRQGSARALYFVSGALIVSVVVYLVAGVGGRSDSSNEFGALFVASIACLIAAEAVRRPILGFLDATFSPRSEDLRSIREECRKRLSSLSSEQEIATLVLRVLRDGIGSNAGWVVLKRGSEWESVEAFGEGELPLRQQAEAASLLVGHQSLVDVALESRTPESLGLISAGVSLVASLRHGDDLLGLILLGESESSSPHAGFELDFVSAVTAQAAIALHNSRLADERAALERHATTARVAIDLMHELGKDLGWLRGLASRLASRAEHDPRLHRGASQLDELADGLVSRMRSFVDDAVSRRMDPPGMARVDELIERSLRTLAGRCGVGRIQLRHDPSVRGLRCHETVGRVVANLVDNAIRASGPSDPVHVSATLANEETILISVVDSGCGIPEHLLDLALQPGFTTRRDEGGMGIGLTISRDMTEALGGRLALGLAPGGGLRAEVHVPIARETAEPN